MKPAPIVIMAYKRVDYLRQTLEAIEKNSLANQSDLIVYSDGPKYPENSTDVANIKLLRELVLSKQWCKNVKLVISDTNKGLNNAFFDGITEVMNTYGKAIVLEEDILVSPNFLEFMNDALNMYENEKNVFHISGCLFKIKTTDLPPSFFLSVANTWGWATWKDRWDKLIRDPAEIMDEIIKKNAYNRLTLDNAEPDYWHQLKANVDGKMDTWDIKWFASIVVNNGLILYSNSNMVENIGFDGSGTHFKNGSMGLDTKINLRKIKLVKQNVEENKTAKKELIRFFKNNKAGIFQRIREKLFLIFTGKLPQN